MNTLQLTKIIGSHNLNTAGHVYIDDIKYIAFSEQKGYLHSDILETRFKFDTTTNLLEVVYCWPYSKSGKTPAHGNYDSHTKHGTTIVFEFLTDLNGDLIIDYYDFARIKTIGMREEKPL
jgi:hypothetical protein